MTDLFEICQDHLHAPWIPLDLLTSALHPSIFVPGKERGLSLLEAEARDVLDITAGINLLDETPQQHSDIEI